MPPQTSPSRSWTWIAATAGPAAWFLCLAVFYAVGPVRDHEMRDGVMLAIAAAGLAVTVTAIVVGWREVRAARHEPSWRIAGRLEGLGTAAIGLGALSLLMIAALAFGVLAFTPA
jgi:hypothetical protein